MYYFKINHIFTLCFFIITTSNARISILSYITYTKYETHIET